MALNGFIEFFQKGKVNAMRSGAHVRYHFLLPISLFGVICSVACAWLSSGQARD